MKTDYIIEGDTLIIHVRGTWSMREQTEVQSVAVQLLKSNNLTAVLIDLREAVERRSASIVHIYESGNALLNNYPVGTRFAIVYANENEDPNKRDFFENVTSNRGVNAKAFGNYDEARSWIG